jgi:uncharacterized spore protein YtfJ
MTFNLNMNEEPKHAHTKITVRTLAFGFSAAWGILKTQEAKDTLNTIIYGHPVELYAALRIIIFLLMIFFVCGAGVSFIQNGDNNARNNAD